MTTSVDVRAPVPFSRPNLQEAIVKKLPVVTSGGAAVEKTALVTRSNCYEVVRIVRESIYGNVRYARALDLPERNGDPFRPKFPARGVAIKIYSKSKMQQMQNQSQENPLSEIAAMQFIGENSHLMTPIECCMDNANIYVIMDYVDGGELFDLVVEKGFLPEVEARDYFRQIVAGVSHLHSLHLCHRDLSLENVLISRETKNCKVIDFGMCLRLPVDENGNALKIHSRGFCGKPIYAAPEVYRQQPTNPMLSDIWSLGIMVFTMVTGRSLVGRANDFDPFFRRICNGQLEVMLTELSANISPLCRDLLLKILKPNPEERLSVAGIRAHPWLSEDTNGPHTVREVGAEAVGAEPLTAGSHIESFTSVPGSIFSNEFSL